MAIVGMADAEDRFQSMLPAGIYPGSRLPRSWRTRVATVAAITASYQHDGHCGHGVDRWLTKFFDLCTGSPVWPHLGPARG